METSKPMKKHIEDMGKLCPFYEEGKCNLLEYEAVECNFYCDMFDFAIALYNAGYRKQEEGEWIYRENEFGNEYYACSICDCQTRYKENYCSNCGAHMQGGKNE